MKPSPFSTSSRLMPLWAGTASGSVLHIRATSWLCRALLIQVFEPLTT